MKPLIGLWITVLLAALTLSGCESLGVALGVLFDSFIFQPAIVQVKDGVVSMPADPRVSEGQIPRVQIAVLVVQK
jgi:hypothetical protein